MRKKERREFSRLNVYHLVKYKVLSDEKEPALPLLATIRDIAAGGLCLKTEQYLSKSSTIELEINFPNLANPIYTLAKVIWVKQRGKNRRYEVGLHFVEIEESLRKIIEERIRFVYKKIKKKWLI